MTAYGRVLALFLLVGVSAGAAESYVVVKTVDIAGASELSVMTAVELKAFEAGIQQDSRLHTKALAMAKAEWAKDEENKRAFPANAINRRSVAPMSPVYRDREAADKKLDRLQERMLEREGTKRQQQNEPHNARPPKGSAQAAREKAAELEREAMDAKARELYEAQLEKLRTAAPGDKSAPPPAGAQKPVPAAGGQEAPKPPKPQAGADAEK